MIPEFRAEWNSCEGKWVMEDGMSSPYAVLLGGVVALVCGWVIGQVVPWRRGWRSVVRASGDGGIEWVLRDVNYTVKRDGKKRTRVRLEGSLHEFGGDNIYVSAETVSSSPIADEMHRLHAAGAMVCSVRPAVKGRRTAEQSGRPLRGSGELDGANGDSREHGRAAEPARAAGDGK